MALIFKKFGSKHDLLHEVIKEILNDYLPTLLNSFFDELIASNMSPSNLGDIKALLLGKASAINNNLGYIKILLFEMNELDTLQEVLFQIRPELFQGEDYLLEQVLNIQKICNIPLNKLGELSDKEVKILNNNDGSYGWNPGRISYR